MRTPLSLKKADWLLNEAFEGRKKYEIKN